MADKSKVPLGYGFTAPCIARPPHIHSMPARCGRSREAVRQEYIKRTMPSPQTINRRATTAFPENR
jgi:hypothetical protein